MIAPDSCHPSAVQPTMLSHTVCADLPDGSTYDPPMFAMSFSNSASPGSTSISTGRVASGSRRLGLSLLRGCNK